MGGSGAASRLISSAADSSGDSQGHADEVGTVGEPVLRHRGAVALEPAVGGRHRGRDTEEGNAPVPVAGEVRDRLAGAAQVVLDHVDAGKPPRGPVDEHHRRPLLPGGQVGLIRAHAHHDQAADLAPQQRLQGGALAVGAVVQAGHHDRHATADQVEFDAARHRGEERVGEVGNGQADRGVRAGAEAAGQQVRHVIQFLHRPAHPLAGLLGDVRIIVEDPGYGLRADSGDTSDIAHGGHRGIASRLGACSGDCGVRVEPRRSGGEWSPGEERRGTIRWAVGWRRRSAAGLVDRCLALRRRLVGLRDDGERGADLRRGRLAGQGRVGLVHRVGPDVVRMLGDERLHGALL